jgi:signal transduction histidine kinase
MTQLPGPPSEGTWSERLLDLSETLVTLRTVPEVLRVVLRSSLETLGASAGVALLADDTASTLELAATEGPVSLSPVLWRPGPLDPTSLAATALQLRSPLLYEQPDDLLCACSTHPAVLEVPPAVAVLPLVSGDRPLGVINLAFSAPHTFTLAEKQFLERLAPHCVAALDRARTLEALERQVQERTERLEAETRAQAAFIAFTEAAGTETDVLVLVKRAIALLQDEHALDVAYFELDDGLYHLRAWNGQFPAALLARSQQGYSPEQPSLARLARDRVPLFVDEWNATAQQVDETGSYGAIALYPFFKDDTLVSVMITGSQTSARWSGSDQALFRAVGRSLALALERADQRLQREEQARTHEAFVAYSEAVGAGSDALALARLAILVLQAHFVTGSATYFVPDGECWTARVWSEDHGAALVTVLTTGLDTRTPLLDDALRLRQPIFRDNWDGGRERVGHSAAYGSAAMYPLVIGDRVHALLGLGLREQRQWREADKALVRAVGRGLELALDRTHTLEQAARRAAQLARSASEVQAAHAELEAFTYAASHDLRTPVRHVQGFSALARKALAGTSEDGAVRYLGLVEQAATQLSEMIDAMLRLSRNGRRQLDFRPVALDRAVAQVKSDLAPQLAGRAVEWRLGPLPVVTADRASIEQVLTLLLSNALKFSRPQEVAIIEVWAEEQDDAWTISVRDNGVGFDPKYRARLFGVFQRLHHQRDFEGTGVGLATVKRLILRHGGQVEADSAGEGGATFRFTLPKER